MCVVSFIGDSWRQNPPPVTTPWIGMPLSDPTQDQIDALKAEMESLKKLLKAAKIYDEETGQADCAMDEKVELIQRLADIVGVDMEDVFPSV